jgi:glycosyltransferase involved in cell wall biosynthesis
LLIGRFNSWKGQKVLLQGVAQLPTELRMRLSVRLVGSVFADQRHFLDELARFIADERLEGTVQICPFSQDPAEHYAWADVVAVPSVKPEPFGLVAIEAMAVARCVIAAGHGGVTEIVVDGVTGSLVTPGSSDSLAAALAQYIRNPQRAASEGRAGKERFEHEFEESRYKRKIADLVGDLAGGHLV